MTISSGIRVVSVQVKSPGEQPELRVAVDVNRAELQAPETVRVWNSTLGHDTPVDRWPAAHQARAHGKVERHVLTAPLPAGVDPNAVEVAVVAQGPAGQANAQEPGHNYRVGYRAPDATGRLRDENGRFVQVDGQAKVRDVATLRRSKALVGVAGDMTVDELRTAFGGLSVSKIARLAAPARAAVLGLLAGGALLGASPAVTAAQLGAHFAD